MPDSIPAPTPPARLALQPRDEHGRVVPAFVAYVDGKPDHRYVREGFVRRASQMRLCFLCDLPLGVYGAFPVGPMRIITRQSAQPPSHRTCAEHAVKACPPLRDGVSAIYITDQWSRHRGRDLFSFQNPFEVTWWIQGRRATYPEALEGMVAALNHLRAQAEQVNTSWDPDHLLYPLAVKYERALALLPASAS